MSSQDEITTRPRVQLSIVPPGDELLPEELAAVSAWLLADPDRHQPWSADERHWWAERLALQRGGLRRFALVEQRDVGYLHAARGRGRLWAIDLVVVAPAWRRAGVGRALVRAVTDQGPAEAAVDERNVAAARFFHAVGLRATGTRWNKRRQRVEIVLRSPRRERPRLAA